MNRAGFIGAVAGTIVIAGVVYYLTSDRRNYARADFKTVPKGTIEFQQDEKAILFLASLAPSGHNTQPWKVSYLAPYHYVIGNDKTKWLPGVDPTQRETILSIGAFAQNLEYAANQYGYQCVFETLATRNQDDSIIRVKLNRTVNTPAFDLDKIRSRRTMRSNVQTTPLKTADLHFLTEEAPDAFYYFPNTSKDYQLLNSQTIEANRLQAYRDAAQQELSEWIRFSSKDAEEHLDGLTTAGMEINGMSGWICRNFYGPSNVMADNFRDKNIEIAQKQVAESAGWLLITSKDNTVASLLETGRRMQRLFLKVREKNIALHPMTQILEEPATHAPLQQSVGITNPVQFILRLGYVDKYPDPVTLRRPVDWFVSQAT